jgi:hypothetical protein
MLSSWKRIAIGRSSCSGPERRQLKPGAIRLKETAPDLEFREHFSWGAKSVVNVEAEFSADEVVERYWIDNVTPCPCRR